MITLRQRTEYLHYDTVDLVVILEHSSWGDYIKTQDTVLKLGLSRQCTLKHSSWEDYIKTQDRVFTL